MKRRPKGTDGDDLVAWVVGRCDQVGECGEWPKPRNQGGYGLMRYRGKQRGLHRVMFELLRGPIPAGMQLDHLCRNRACCNPWHLEVVTQRENIMRGVNFSAVNAAKTQCHNGHPLAADNLHIDSRGKRSCRVCDRARHARRRRAT
jgi:hypothetical protein